MDTDALNGYTGTLLSFRKKYQRDIQAHKAAIDRLWNYYKRILQRINKTIHE